MNKDMTKKERYLRALRNEATDRIVWAPNIDYWVYVNTAEGTMPEEFCGMSSNDILRQIGATIWRRAPVLREEYDGVTISVSEHNGEVRTCWETPVGKVETLEVPSEGKARARFLKEHMIKKLEDIRIVKYIIEATRYVPDYQTFLKTEQEVGDDGITLTYLGCVPFIKFCKMDAGWVNGLYMWMDHRTEVEDLLCSYEKKYVEMYTITADSPAPVISTGDNMDEVTMNPSLFKQYAIPFYQRISKILHSHGKIFEAHWDGRTKNLLELAPVSGLDVVEGVVTKPMADITVTEAMDKLQSKVVMQGGIPSVFMCHEGSSRDEFISYVKDIINTVKGRRGFVLGMADNVPPNADFERVRIVSDIVNS